MLALVLTAIIAHLIAAPTTTLGNVPEEDLFPFGIKHGDLRTTPHGTGYYYWGGSPPLPPFNITDGSFCLFYVDENGIISFDKQMTDPTPSCAGGSAKAPYAIFPYWADVDTYQGLGGDVYFRLTFNEKVTVQATAEIKAAFPETSENVDIQELGIITWYQVPFAGAAAVCNHTNSTVPRNTFQVGLAIDGNSGDSYVILYYTNLTWTTGAYSQGDCSGLGGAQAMRGFVSDSSTWDVLPGSCTADVLSATDTSNYGYPGKWVFRVDGEITDPSAGSSRREWDPRRTNRVRNWDGPGCH